MMPKQTRRSLWNKPCALLVSAGNDDDSSAPLGHYLLDSPAHIIGIIDNHQPFVVRLRPIAKPSKHYPRDTVYANGLLLFDMLLRKPQLGSTSSEAGSYCFLVWKDAPSKLSQLENEKKIEVHDLQKNGRLEVSNNFRVNNLRRTRTTGVTVLPKGH